MSQKPYFRDVWALGPPSSNGYPGAFPRGFVAMVKKRWWGQKRLWLFAGSFKDPDGITVDIKPEVNPDVIANCENLPFKDNSFDFVMADPPYSEEEAERLYSLPYCSMVRVLNEMIRVCKPGGHVLMLHRLVVQMHPHLRMNEMDMVGVVGVFTMAGLTNIRALTVYRKKNTLAEFEDHGPLSPLPETPPTPQSGDQRESLERGATGGADTPAGGGSQQVIYDNRGEAHLTDGGESE